MLLYKALVPIRFQFKMCNACREKNRFSHARAATRRKREGREATTTIENSHDPEMKALEQDDNEPEPEEEGGISPEGWDQMRKRTKMEFANLEGKGKVPVKSTQLKVRQFLHLSLQNTTDDILCFRNLQKRPLPTTDTSSNVPVQYQTPAFLFSTLSVQYKPKPLIYSATCSIISTSTPPIGLKRRVELVSRELLKELKNAGQSGFEWVSFVHE